MVLLNKLTEAWFDAIEDDDVEALEKMLEEDKVLLETEYQGADYDDDIKPLANELLGKKVGSLDPLLYACFVESEDTALTLAKHFSIEKLCKKWGDGNTVLHLAAFNGLENLIEYLLAERHVPAKYKNKLGYRPMDCVANDDVLKIFAKYRGNF